jgi:hypothetical protein
MHITHLRTDIKGRQIEVSIKPATVVIGPNFSGKTAVLTAIKLGLAGALPPPIGKTGQAIYSALATSPNDPGELRVEMLLVDTPNELMPRHVVSTWQRSPTGSVRVDFGMPAKLRLPAVLVDPRQFFSMTAAQRTKAVFEACASEGVSTAGIRSYLTARVGDRDLVGKIVTDIERCLATLSMPAAIQHGIDFAKEIAKAGRDEAATQVGILAALTDPGPIPQDHSAEIAKEQALLLEAQTRWADAKAAGAQGAVLDDIRSLIDRNKAEISLLHYEDSEIPPRPDSMELPLWPGETKPISEGEWVTRIDRIKKANAQLENRRSSLRALMRTGNCPTCGAPSLAKFAQSLAEVPADADTKPLEATLDSWRKVKAEAVKCWDEYRANQKRIGELEKQVRDSEDVLRRAAEARKPEASVGELSLEVHRIELRISLYQEQQVQYVAYREKIGKIEQARRLHAEATASETVAGSIARALVEYQAEHIDTVFKEVLAVSRAFTDGILNSPLEYENGELGRRVSEKDVEMGCRSPVGSWISHEAFSGTEEALAYMAFAVAISTRAPFKIVFFDEMGRMDSATARRVLVRMLELLDAGVIDQFLGACTGSRRFLDINHPRLYFLEVAGAAG